MLLACGRPVVFATLELTAQALVTPERVAALRALGTGLCLAAACRWFVMPYLNVVKITLLMNFSAACADLSQSDDHRNVGSASLILIPLRRCA